MKKPVIIDRRHPRRPDPNHRKKRIAMPAAFSLIWAAALLLEKVLPHR